MEDKESLNIKIIGPVDTTTPDPWRTQGDYQQDQKDARERHAMIQEQHKIILRSYRINIFAVLAAGLSAIAALSAVVIAWLAYKQ